MRVVVSNVAFAFDAALQFPLGRDAALALEIAAQLISCKALGVVMSTLANAL
jgi:hypothetical protein